MQRPDLDTFACVNPDCQRFRLTGQGHLIVRKVYGQDGIRRLRCPLCGETCSERCGTALCNTTIGEAHAKALIDHRGEGCGVRATARLSTVSKDMVVRLLQMAGRHAERWHDHRVRHVPPRALACDEPGAACKKTEAVSRH